ncbi:MAG TPA: STAS domain-containing protein [Pseudonocardia sp.]|nr:STAS domain-containing protein [Pseudonocardia sp.]
MRSPESALRIGVEAHGEAVVLLRPAGDVDLLTTPSLRRRMRAGVRRHRHVVVDLSAVEYLASVAIQALVEAQQLAERGGSALYLTGAGHRRVARPLALTGLDPVLSVSDQPAHVLVPRLAAAAGPPGERSRRPRRPDPDRPGGRPYPPEGRS